MEKIQEILFENKEHIQDGVYLELMNALSPPKKYYKITYLEIVPKMMVFDSDDLNSNIVLKCKQPYRFETIVECDKVSEFQRQFYFEKEPFIPFEYDGPSLFNFQPQSQRVRVHDVIMEKKCEDHLHLDDDFKCDCCDDYRNIATTLVYEVKPTFIVLMVQKI
jgi:hypothetical protein